VAINKKNEGSNFEDWLKEEGILEDCTETAIKRVLAYQIEQQMKEKKINKSQMAEKMETSRAAINRLLDPDNESVTLHTLKKAAQILGRRIVLTLA
jgi:predicted XRE-type DNA-binding protein